MARGHQRNRGTSWRPWALVLLWVMVIWGHSLMPGDASSAESSVFVKAAQRVVYVIYQQHFALFDRLAQAHPHFLLSLTDPEVMHFYVRKAGHFSEYLVLACFTLNAVRRTLSGFLSGALAALLFWVATPCVDEWIQLHVPGRAGMLTDVLIDMSGFATGLVLGLVVWGVCAAIAWLFGLVAGGTRRAGDEGSW